MPFGDWDGDGETSLPEALGTAAALDALLGRGDADGAPEPEEDVVTQLERSTEGCCMRLLAGLGVLFLLGLVGQLGSCVFG